MNRVIADVKVERADWSMEEAYSLAWIWQVLWVVLVISMFAIVYLNFSIRVGTSRLNALISKGISLQEKRDVMLLEKEKLQMNHYTQEKARMVLGYQLAKKAKVVNIKI